MAFQPLRTWKIEILNARQNHNLYALITLGLALIPPALFFASLLLPSGSLSPGATLLVLAVALISFYGTVTTTPVLLIVALVFLLTKRRAERLEPTKGPLPIYKNKPELK